MQTVRELNRFNRSATPTIIKAIKERISQRPWLSFVAVQRHYYPLFRLMIEPSGRHKIRICVSISFSVSISTGNIHVSRDMYVEGGVLYWLYILSFAHNTQAKVYSPKSRHLFYNTLRSIILLRLMVGKREKRRRQSRETYKTVIASSDRKYASGGRKK